MTELTTDQILRAIISYMDNLPIHPTEALEGYTEPDITVEQWNEFKEICNNL